LLFFVFRCKVKIETGKSSSSLKKLNKKAMNRKPFTIADEVLSFLRDGGNVFDLNYRDFINRSMTIDEMRIIFKKRKAIWERQGEPCAEQPHAILSNPEFHSNGVIYTEEVLKYPALCEIFAEEIVKKFFAEEFTEQKDLSFTKKSIDTIVSYSPYLGSEVARIIKKRFNHEVAFVLAEQGEAGGPVKLSAKIDNGKVLIVQDLIPNGSGIISELKKAILKQNPSVEILKHAYVLVHRTNAPTDNPLIVCFQLNIKNVLYYECPDCKNGSKGLIAQEGNNINILNGIK